MTGGRILAVLETSFWTAAYRAEVIANWFDMYDIVVPRAVEAEIGARQPTAPRREYPYASLFRHLRAEMRDPPPGAPPPVPMFGAGEAEAITLAEFLNARLLINERRAASFAAHRNVPFHTVPSVILMLWRREVISLTAARRKLALIAPITARSIIQEARRALESR